jgi:hypothetical protein
LCIIKRTACHQLFNYLRYSNFSSLFFIYFSILFIKSSSVAIRHDFFDRKYPEVVLRWSNYSESTRLFYTWTEIHWFGLDYEKYINIRRNWTKFRCLLWTMFKIYIKLFYIFKLFWYINVKNKKYIILIVIKRCFNSYLRITWTEKRYSVMANGV